MEDNADLRDAEVVFTDNSKDYIMFPSDAYYDIESRMFVVVDKGERRMYPREAVKRFSFALYKDEEPDEETGGK